MGFAAPVLMAVGTGLSAVGEIQGGKAADRAGRTNQQIKNNQATYVEGAAAAQVADLRRSFEKFRGGLNADLAAYGAPSNEGTGLLLAQEAARGAMLDQLNILTEGKNQANSLRMGGQMDRYEGSVAKTQGYLGGFATALNGFSKYKQMTQGA